MENVAALNSKRFEDVHKFIYDKFQDWDYTVFTKIINMAYHGVAQQRKRLFIVAFRESIDATKFEWPKGTDQIKTSGDILSPDAWVASMNDPNLDLDKAWEERALKSQFGVDLMPTNPSRTFTTRNLMARTNDFIRIKMDNGVRRRLTREEMMLLHGFSKDEVVTFDWGNSSHWKIPQMIGNSVPREWSRFLMKCVLKACNDKKTGQRKQAQQHGKPEPKRTRPQQTSKSPTRRRSQRITNMQKRSGSPAQRTNHGSKKPKN